MLPSMCSPMESETFPPDICYSSGETATPSPPTWVKSACEPLSIKNMPNANDDDNRFLRENVEITPTEDCLEGAVGGILPDLCNTGVRAKILNDSVSETNITFLPNIETHEELLTCEGSSKDQANSSSTVYSESVSESTSEKLCLSCDDSNFIVKKIEDKTLNHKNINLLPCETGDLKNKLHCTLENKESLSSIKSESLPCAHDPYGALEEEEELEEKSSTCVELGLDLVRKNVLHSSHPSYHEWKCSAVIPSYLLSTVSLHSHGTSLGYNVRTPIDLSGTHGRSSMGERDAASEDEQIKMAKRFGLIRHLPCGVFDGSTKTRECVICMIDFSVGDRVRYLPCMHTYHTDCIDDWLVRSFTCPSCLEPVDAALLSTYETT